jgi:NADH:ubiquinone oxidoreductase subunit F (NADH-binding)
MRAIPGRSWTAACWKAIRTVCSKAWPSPPTPSGADQGFIYVRAEYPLAIAACRSPSKQAKQMGLLGAGIFESPFNFNVDLRIGAGAFVCGEETALMASVEGKRGAPRPRPPFPGGSGLFGCPTLLNNVETFANVARHLSQAARSGSRALAPRRARAPKFLRWPARSRTPA